MRWERKHQRLEISTPAHGQAWLSIRIL